MMRSVCLLLGLFPCVWGFVQHCQPASARPMLAPAPRPALAFDQYALDYANVGTRAVVQAHFDFTNTSSQKVQVTKLDPSCGCISPQLEGRKTVFEPGESGRFFVKLNTANETPGPKQFQVKVQYDDGTPQEQLVVWRMTLPQKKLQIEPKEVYFYQLGGKAESRTIYITDYRRPTIETVGHSTATISPLEVVDLQWKAFSPSGDPKTQQIQTIEGLINAEVLPVEETEHGRRIPIRLDVPRALPPERTTALLLINTTDPEFPKLYVSVLLQGEPTSSSAAIAPER